MDEFEVLVTLPGTPEQFGTHHSAPIVVGRSDDCDIVLRHALVSRRHVAIEPLSDGVRFLVRDLGSRNGTTVNGVLIRAEEVTVDGEATLQIGPYLVTIRDGATASDETVPLLVARGERRTTLDRGIHTFACDGKVVIERVSGQEFTMLERLDAAAPKLVATAELGDAIWGKGRWDSYMLHNVVRRIRKKLEAHGLEADEVLVSVAGVGYRIA